MCKVCKNYGINLSEYTVYPRDVMIKFEALNPAKNTVRNTANTNINTIIDFKIENLRIDNNRSGYWKILK